LRSTQGVIGRNNNNDIQPKESWNNQSLVFYGKTKKKKGGPPGGRQAVEAAGKEIQLKSNLKWKMMQKGLLGGFR